MTSVGAFFTYRQGVNIAILANYILLAILIVIHSVTAQCEPPAARLIVILLWLLVLLVIAYVWVTCRERLWWMLPQMLALALAIMSLATMTIYQSQGSGDICLYDPNPIKFELRKK
ncbi:hypothetical protein [Asticcacaulis sp.]|uniref:hypothetical protein n=1 Tax=Asticcacaulis sp. TaxID=1872648 RepID=UPI003F7B94FC